MYLGIESTSQINGILESYDKQLQTIWKWTRTNSTYTYALSWGLETEITEGIIVYWLSRGVVEKTRARKQ